MRTQLQGQQQQLLELPPWMVYVLSAVGVFQVQMPAGAGLLACRIVWHTCTLSMRCRCVWSVPTQLLFCCCGCVLQVRSDCPPRQLVEFLVSDTGVMADQVRLGGRGG
jgi:hypothetical protein